MNTKETFAKRIQKAMGDRVPDCVPRGSWQGRKYPHIYADLRSNFIDGTYPEFCSIKGIRTVDRIKYHKGAAHMNSSQVVCISYFKKFFERPEYEAYLLSVLREAGIRIESGETINSAVFEYEPSPEERTNFDFYMELGSGIHLSFEIKYTEAEFGGISPDKDDPDKYVRKWNMIYQDMADKSPYLLVDREAFYQNYQINRNIAYAGDEDYVLFLTPKANDAKGLNEGRNYIDGMQNPHIRNLYWEDIMKITQRLVDGCEELMEYYDQFYHKYIEILNQE